MRTALEISAVVGVVVVAGFLVKDAVSPEVTDPINGGSTSPLGVVEETGVVAAQVGIVALLARFIIFLL